MLKHTQKFCESFSRYRFREVLAITNLIYFNQSWRQTWDCATHQHRYSRHRILWISRLKVQNCALHTTPRQRSNEYIELSVNWTWLLVRSWLFCIPNLPSSVSCLCILGGSVGFERRSFYINSVSFKLDLVPKSVWPTMNSNRLLFIQIQNLPPSIHHKWKEAIDILSKTTNENHTGPT